MDSRSPLGQVKDLGSALNGTHHWLMESITAIALVPLTVWFTVFIIKASDSAESVLVYMSQPCSAIAAILFVGLVFYHGYLGIGSVAEDYVHSSWKRFAFKLFLNFVGSVTVLAFVMAVLSLQFGSGVSPHYGYKKAPGGYHTNGVHGSSDSDFYKRLKKQHP